jgi:hypothetical protein
LRTAHTVTALGVLILLIVFSVILNLISPKEHPFADIDSCQLYVAVYDFRVEQRDGFLVRDIFKPITIQANKYNNGRPPKKFERYTGEVKTIESIVDGQTYDKKITEDFELDTSAFFTKDFSNLKVNISECFEGLETKPEIGEASSEEIVNQDFSDKINNRPLISQWGVTTPAFSRDRKTAIIYAEFYCGGLCGSGDFYLFEKRNEHWEIAGWQTLWVS